MGNSLITTNNAFLRVACNNTLEINIAYMAKYVDMELNALKRAIHKSKEIRLDGNFLNSSQVLALITSVLQPLNKELYSTIMGEMVSYSHMVIMMRNDRLRKDKVDRDSITLTYKDYLKGVELFIAVLSGVYPEGKATIH